VPGSAHFRDAQFLQFAPQEGPRWSWCFLLGCSRLPGIPAATWTGPALGVPGWPTGLCALACATPRYGPTDIPVAGIGPPTREGYGWDESVTAMRRRMRAVCLETASSPPLGALPLGRGRGLLAQVATAPMEHSVSVVSEPGYESRGTPGCPAVALPRQQPMLDLAVAVPGSAPASPVSPTATKPTLLPGDGVTPDQR